MYMSTLYIYIYIYFFLSLHIYIVIVCDHEITHTSYAICPNKIYIKLYGLFLWMRCLKARQSHYEGIIYFLPEHPGTH